MFEIIKNAELPENGRSLATALYPFAQLEVGDGFDAPRDMGKLKSGSDRRQSSIASCASAWTRRRNSNAKFAVRILDENTVRCVRIV